MTFGKYAYCQDIAAFSNIVKKANQSDSSGYYFKTQHFPIVRVEKENCILSVDQSKVHFLYGPTYNSAKNCYLQVPVKLTNRSADTLKYIGMSCSWWDIYQTDNKDLRIFPTNVCFKNSSITFELAPYHETNANIVIMYPKKAIKAQSFKIGMLIHKVVDLKQKRNVQANEIAISASPVGYILWTDDILIPVVLSR